MRIIECEQRSPAWYEARLGIPTASNFHRIVTRAGKERKGATPEAYLLSLVAETLTRTPQIVRSSAAMDRGRELEAFARRWYEEHTGRKLREVGFIVSDDGRYGCSPDGITIDGGLEIKCPMLPAFMDYAATMVIPDDYYIQVQASLWITGAQAWDYLVYTDVRGLLPILRRVTPNQTMHEALNAIIPAFCNRIEAMGFRFRDAGNGVPADTPIDLSALEAVPDDEMEIKDIEQIGL